MTTLSDSTPAAAAAAAAPSASASSATAPSPSSDVWDPTQYLLFDEPRARPGIDLLQRAQATLAAFRLPAPQYVADLGCGPGKQVMLLAKTFPSAHVSGVDSSANMLAAARRQIESASADDTSLRSRVDFTQASFEDYTAPAASNGGLDLLYSNAALHWSRMHNTLFPHLMQQLRPNGGVLAVQMPGNFREPSHTCIREALLAGNFFASASEMEKVWSLCPSIDAGAAAHYWHLLAPHARHVDAWETQYQQLMTTQGSSPYHPVLEWTKSTALAPILAALPSEEERTRFQHIYSDLLAKAYPTFQRDGKTCTLFPFKRVFLVAVR